MSSPRTIYSSHGKSQNWTRALAKLAARRRSGACGFLTDEDPPSRYGGGNLHETKTSIGRPTTRTLTSRRDSCRTLATCPTSRQGAYGCPTDPCLSLRDCSYEKRRRVERIEMPDAAIVHEATRHDLRPMCIAAIRPPPPVWDRPVGTRQGTVPSRPSRRQSGSPDRTASAGQMAADQGNRVTQCDDGNRVIARDARLCGGAAHSRVTRRGKGNSANRQTKRRGGNANWLAGAAGAGSCRLPRWVPRSTPPGRPRSRPSMK